jgi:hypothetical protein
MNGQHYCATSTDGGIAVQLENSSHLAGTQSTVSFCSKSAMRYNNIAQGICRNVTKILYRTAVLPQSVPSVREPASRQLPRHTSLISAVASSCLATTKGVYGEPDMHRMEGMLGRVLAICKGDWRSPIRSWCCCCCLRVRFARYNSSSSATLRRFLQHLSWHHH